MAITKSEIIASAIIGLLLVFLFIVDTLLPYTLQKTIYKASYIINTLLAALIFFPISYLHFRRTSTLRWKILIVGVFLGSAGAILSLCFLPCHIAWDFQFHVIFGIDAVGMVVFLLVIFVRDKKITILVALLVSAVDLFYINQENKKQIEFYSIFTGIISIIIYFVLSLIYIKHFSNKRWKVAVITIPAFTIIVLALFFCVYKYHKWQVLFFLITSIDACSALVLGLWIYAQKTWRLHMLRDDQNNYLEMAGLPTRFTTKELEAATRNCQTPIGEGGSSTVFKGTMEDGSTVAVKRIKGQASGEAEFRTEITIIASLQHVNLVKLLGYCLSPTGDRYLIYPFFENGSLDAWLFTEKEKRARLTWMLRYRIAINVAKALAYFHHECHHQILHLDIKPANILLDSSFRALVSDFGISKSIGKDESSVMTRARGTIGYLAPEMLVPNAISIKSDVYSYGMVLLELVGGRRNLMSVVDIESQQRRDSYFPKIAKDKMRENKLMEVVDPSLELEVIREDEVSVLVRAALWCIQENPELRPSTTEVVDMLEGRTPVPMPPESPMFVVNFLDVEAKAQNEEAALLSANTISISILSGR